MTVWRKWSTGPKSPLPPSARPASRGEIQFQSSDQVYPSVSLYVQTFVFFNEDF